MRIIAHLCTSNSVFAHFKVQTCPEQLIARFVYIFIFNCYVMLWCRNTITPPNAKSALLTCLELVVVRRGKTVHFKSKVVVLKWGYSPRVRHFRGLKQRNMLIMYALMALLSFCIFIIGLRNEKMTAWNGVMRWANFEHCFETSKMSRDYNVWTTWRLSE